MLRRGLCLLAVLVLVVRWPAGVLRLSAAGQTYYVSSSEGDDDNDGLSEGAPFATVAKVNGLALQPGDSVRFKCGDVWHADPLIITQSGAEASPITFGAYPAGCAERPVLSGAQPIAGWASHDGDVYVADLSAGANAGRFAHGVNQLFQGAARLPMGRWPNLDAGDGGYASIDAQPAGDQISDAALPAVDWTGAAAHIRGMRWYILNRDVTGTSGQTLTLGHDAQCWGGDCTGWGYFLNRHRATLDREGEWYYDAATHRVYLYTEAGAPADDAVAGSVVLRDDDRAWGGVVLGDDLGDPIHHVVVEDLDVRRWYRNGVTTPTNWAHYESHDLTLRDLVIRDVDRVGVNLAAWVYDAQDGRPSGWRGGYRITVRDTVIERANQRGIDSYARASRFEDNVIRDVGLIENLGAAGMGCGPTSSGGFCTEDGDGIRIKVGQAADSGNNNAVVGNRLERIAYNGIDVFGHTNTFERNVIRQACYAKGDCGGVRAFGSGDLSSTAVHTLSFEENLILNTLGNTDGCIETYDPLFGFGFYIDHYARDVTLRDNSVISATAAGVLYQNATGSVTGNVLYNNARGSMWSAQVVIDDAPSYLSAHSGNVLYGRADTAWTLSAAPDRLGVSDDNAFFQPYQDKYITSGGWSGRRTLAEWQSYSGKDANSKAAWFTLAAGEPPRSRIFYNDTATARTVDLGSALYYDLDRAPVAGSLTLAPFTSQVLIYADELADLSLTLASVGAVSLAPGGAVTYTLTVSNAGTLAAAAPALTHTVPAQIRDTAWSGTPGVVERSGHHYAWTLPQLAPGGSSVVTVTGTFTDALETGSALALHAQVSTATPESHLGNNTALLRLGTWHVAYLPVLLR